MVAKIRPIMSSTYITLGSRTASPKNYSQHTINQRVTNVGKDGATCIYQFLSHCSVYVLQPTKLINISETTKLCWKYLP